MTAWKTTVAAEYCTSVRDGTHDSPKSVSDGFPLVTSKAVKEGELDFANANLISQQDFDEVNRRSKVDQWDVLFTMIGTLGEVYLERSNDISYAIKNVGLFKVGDELKAKWLYYWFRAPNIKNEILQQRRGASQQYLPLGTLRNLVISHPENWNVARKIIEIVSAYDDLIENNRRRIQLLEESARLLYQEWFVHLRFPGHEQVKIADGVPEGWEKKPLKQIATLNYGKALKAEVRVPGPFPVYGSSGEVGSHEKALVKGPGIVVGRKGNVGSVYWVNTDFYPIDTVYYISAEESSLFLYHALQNVQFINTDVAVPGLNRDMAYSREILVPDDKNYQRFLSEALPLQEQINKLQDYNIKLAQARDLLLPKLMSGELTV